MSASGSGSATPSRRPATPAEARALASPLRLRILRLTIDEPLTNAEIADRLGRDPGTVLHHVRTLVKAGFLAPEAERPGPRGSVLRPYRATGKSWTLDVSDPAAEHAVSGAALQAFVEEVREAGGLLSSARLALRLTEAERAELEQRLTALLDEFAARPRRRSARPVALFTALYRGPADVGRPGSGAQGG